MRTFDVAVAVANPLRHEPNDDGITEAVVTLSVRVVGQAAEDIERALRVRDKQRKLTLVVTE